LVLLISDQGEKDAMHTHPSGWYYVTQPGTMKLAFADGKVATWEAKQGEGGWLQTKAPHAAENVGKTTLVYVLVEVKSAEATRSPAAQRSERVHQ
jgi:oxalate decarboxylase/phosphoglucose isomerase-like protein (cupin superfamily)